MEKIMNSSTFLRGSILALFIIMVSLVVSTLDKAIETGGETVHLIVWLVLSIPVFGSVFDFIVNGPKPKIYAPDLLEQYGLPTRRWNIDGELSETSLFAEAFDEGEGNDYDEVNDRDE